MEELICALFRWIFRLDPKCYVCRVRDSFEKGSTPRYGIYGETQNLLFFHTSCVDAALDDPEFFGHNTVDRALFITDQIKTLRKENRSKRDRQAKRIEDLKNDEFWGDLAMSSLLR